jgi:hypothetical protein
VSLVLVLRSIWELAESPLRVEDERQPNCFTFEEERGEAWKGGGAMEGAIKETRPSL